MDSHQLAIVWCDVCKRELRSDASRARGRGPRCEAKLQPRRRSRARPRRPLQTGPDLFDGLGR